MSGGQVPGANYQVSDGGGEGILDFGLPIGFTRFRGGLRT